MQAFVQKPKPAQSIGNNLGSAVLRRQCACGSRTSSASGDCSECGAKKRLQTSLLIGASNDPLEAEADRIADHVSTAPAPPAIGAAPLQIQRDLGRGSATPEAAPASVDRVLAGAGSPLEPAVRERMEQHFGHDFSRVRVHASAAAQESARDVEAKAYTVGHDIVFGAGQYAPSSRAGQRLLAHELTHVVQQAAASSYARRTIRRSKCEHDAPKSAGCGKFTSTAGGEALFEVGADRIVAAAMKREFGGEWIGQVYSPPNAAKQTPGKMFGGVDVMKVTAGSTLTLGVAEIKSRNTGLGTGGCVVATSDTNGYLSAYAPIAPRMAAISKGLEAIGGLSLPDCRTFNKTIEAKLKSAGVNRADNNDMFAWCTLNSIQNKIGRPFVKGFDSVVFQAATDGAYGEDYTALIMPIRCGTSGTGFMHMVYQVNKKGGVSYRCRRICRMKKEERKQLEDNATKDIEIDTGKGKQKIKVEDQIGDENENEDRDVVIDPDNPGIDVTDVALFSAAALATIAALQKAAERKAATEIEKQLARKTAERLAQELERRGARELAKTLDSTNLVKLGTKAYQPALEKAEEQVAKRLLQAGEKRLAKKLATKLGEKAAKKGAQELLKKGSKAIPYVGLAITLVEVGMMGDAYAKGAEIEFGLSGSDASLSGDTKVDVKGGKAKEQPTSDVKATDTQIDIDVAKPPNMSGIVELETNKVTLKGKLPGIDGAKVMVNLKVKLENTTITYKSMGTIKGGTVLLDGAFDFKDSTIEIDIPPDSQTDASVQEGVHREVKGVKVKVTKAGGGGAGVGSGSAPATKTPAADPGKSKDDKPADPEAAERTKLVTEIQADPQLKAIYDQIFTKTGTPQLEVLRRIAALKARLAGKPELANKLLAAIQKGEKPDPIKDLIEPMERALDALERNQEVKPADAPSDSKPAVSAEHEGDKPGSGSKPKSDKQPAGGASAPAPTEAEKAAATPISFWGYKAKKYQQWTPQDPVPKNPPTGKLPVRLERVIAKGVVREYRFWIYGTFQRDIAHFDSARFDWQAIYKFAAPTQIVKSTQGDYPIYFDDGGAEHDIEYGQLKAPKAAKKKK